MQRIIKKFPDLDQQQIEQLEALDGLYRDLNSKVNVISRKDIDNLYLHHVLHSMFIHFVNEFQDGSDILDLGTGGGFPGIPLAILYPRVKFTLVDGTKKKIGVAQEVIHTLGLKNVVAIQQRAEEMKNQKFDFVICRAVASIDKLLAWSRPLLKTEQQHGFPNGLFAWKGGDPIKEINLLPKHEYTEAFPISDYSDDEYFKEKYIMYVQG
ncbi:MAG: 16S rRNA (guanine527-N7)-methyltransferase [Maribacter sp.]|jgi:16S rRNA (guanine527-N7)-methyltransferase